MKAYKHYLLGLLTIILLFNYVDRLALGIVLEDIKADLNLTDTKLGFLTGIAFALFYSFMGIPIARWADRGNRATIISLTAALWSFAVALCGMAGSFAQLLLIRVGVAVGEAGCIPPAFSLMADYFTRAERPRAAAIYGLGAPLSGVVGYFLAGWLHELYGWRTTFLLLGPPGVVLAIVAWLTLREPRCTQVAMPDGLATAPLVSVASMKEVCATLFTNTTFRHLVMCQAVMSFFVTGILQWLPTFFIRSHGLSTGEIGTWMAVTLGLGGLAGTYLGGELASRHAVRNEPLQLKGLTMAMGSAGLLSVFAYLAPSAYWAFVFIGLFVFGLTTANGPLFAMIQSLVSERMRAQAFALLYLFVNLIGMGLGPLAAGMLSDVLRPWAGEDSLRYALLLLCPGTLWAGWHAWCASRTVVRDLAAAQTDSIQLNPT